MKRAKSWSAYFPEYVRRIRSESGKRKEERGKRKVERGKWKRFEKKCRAKICVYHRFLLPLQRI